MVTDFTYVPIKTEFIQTVTGIYAPTCSPVKFWMKVRLVELIIAT